MSIQTLMHLMAHAVDEGKVRAVGVSNYSAKQMRVAHTVLARRGIPLASNQVQYSLLHRHPETDGVLDACRELGVTLIAYMPLRSGALTGKYSTTTRPAGWRRYRKPFRGKSLETLQRLITLLTEIGARYDRSPSQVAPRWLTQQEAVLPIPGAKNESRLPRTPSTPSRWTTPRWTHSARSRRRRNRSPQGGHAESYNAAQVPGVSTHDWIVNLDSSATPSNGVIPDGEPSV